MKRKHPFAFAALLLTLLLPALGAACRTSSQNPAVAVALTSPLATPIPTQPPALTLTPSPTSSPTPTPRPTTAWYAEPPPTRTFFVAPTGSGDGSRAAPFDLTTAVTLAQPGDHFWLLPGVYEGGTSLLMTNGGTAGAPIHYRACPDARVTLDGGVGFVSAHTWLWGLEMTNLTPPDDVTSFIRTPDGPVKGGSALVNVKAPGSRLINNIIHDAAASQSGIGGWDGGPGQVYYGNIVYGNGIDPDLTASPHGAYAQNNFPVDGYKYFVGNLFLDHSDLCGEKCYNFHAYTRGEGFVSGFYLWNNIIANGRVALGGSNAWSSPADAHVVVDNYFYNLGEMQLGVLKAWQGVFTGNYIGRDTILKLNLWGAGDPAFTPPGPTVVTGNTFVHHHSGHHIDLFARISIGSLGDPALRPDDRFAGNYYGEQFKAKYWVGGQPLSITSLTEWQSQTAADGNTTGLDRTSVVGPNPTRTAVFITPNEYEPGRGHIAIYNWAGQAETAVDLAPLLTPGTPFAIHTPRGFYDPPLVSGVYDGTPVSLPTPDEFHAFVVRSMGGSGSGICAPPAAASGASVATR